MASFSGSMKQALAVPAYLGLTASRAIVKKRPPDPTNPPGSIAKASRQGDQPVAVSWGQEVVGDSGSWLTGFSELKLEQSWAYQVSVTCNDTCFLFPLCFSPLCFQPPLYLPALGPM